VLGTPTSAIARYIFAGHPLQPFGKLSAGPSLIAAGALLGLAAHPQSIPVLLTLFTLATIGNAYLPALWALPTELLCKSAAAASVGMINAVGSVAGFAGPYLFGYMNTKFGSFSYGLTVLALSLLAAGLLVLRIPKKTWRPDSKNPRRVGLRENRFVVWRGHRPAKSHRRHYLQTPVCRWS
jgi:predicted MFS family arabinose efflux permease